MKNSLKTSVQMFGVAGLVILAGCGSDTTVNDTVVEPIEIVEEQTVDQGSLGEGVTIQVEDTPTSEGAAGEVAQEMDIEDSEVTSEEEAIEASGEVEGDVTFDMPYDSPAGPHTMPATLTVVDGVVTAASTTPEEGVTNGAVKKWQAAFVESFETAVVGKSIAQLQDIDAIGGASLTTDGFKEAVASL